MDQKYLVSYYMPNKSRYALSLVDENYLKELQGQNLDQFRSVAAPTDSYNFYGIKGTSTADYNWYRDKAVGQVAPQLTSGVTDQQLLNLYNNQLKTQYNEFLGKGYNSISQDEFAGWNEYNKMVGVSYGRPTTPEAQAIYNSGLKYVSDYMTKIGQKALESTMPTISREQSDALIQESLRKAQIDPNKPVPGLDGYNPNDPGNSQSNADVSIASASQTPGKITMVNPVTGQSWEINDADVAEFKSKGWTQSSTTAGGSPTVQTTSAPSLASVAKEVYVKADGTPIDPSKYTNLAPDSADFNSWLKENNISKVSTADSNLSGDVIAGKETTPDLIGASAKMNQEAAAAASLEYYGKPRVQDLKVEQQAAQELAAFLDTKKAGDKTLRQTITADNWSKYVNAYLYGGYSMDDIANDLYSRATGGGGGIVHPTIGRNEWMASQAGQLPGQAPAGSAGQTGTSGQAGTGAGATGAGASAGTGTPTVTDIKRETIANNPTTGGTVNDGTNFEELNTKLTEISTEILDRQQFYDQQEAIITNREGSQAAINRELSKLSQEKNKEMAFLEMRQSIAKGNYDRAREVSQQQFQNDLALTAETRQLLKDGIIPLTDEMAAQLDPTQYMELPDGSKWLKDTAGTALDFSTVDNWAKNVMDGVATLSNVPDEVRGAVSDRVRELVEGGYTALTPNQKDNLMKLVTQVKSDPGYRDMLDVANGYNTTKAGYEAQGNFGDLAMINGFQRMIDPGAVVREGEFKTVGEAQGITGRLQLWLGLGGASVWAGDKLTVEARNKLMSVSSLLYNEKAKFYGNQTGAQYKALSEAMGVDPKMVMKEFPQDSVSIDNNMYNIFSDQVAPEVQARIDNIASIFLTE